MSILLFYVYAPKTNFMTQLQNKLIFFFRQSNFFAKQKWFPIPYKHNKFLISLLFYYQLDSKYGFMSAIKGGRALQGAYLENLELLKSFWKWNFIMQMGDWEEKLFYKKIWLFCKKVDFT